MRSTSRCASAKAWRRAAGWASSRCERALATLDVFAHFCRASGLGERRGRRGRHERDPRRRERRGASWRGRASASGCRSACSAARQEARYGYLAAVNSTTLSDGCVLDLGGGSLQLVRVADRLARESGSWRAGHGADERALPAAERARQAQAARGAARPRRRASSRRPPGSPTAPRAAAAGAWWASAGPCATSPPPPSAPRGCRPTACRAW